MHGITILVVFSDHDRHEVGGIDITIAILVSGFPSRIHTEAILVFARLEHEYEVATIK